MYRNPLARRVADTGLPYKLPARAAWRRPLHLAGIICRKVATLTGLLGAKHGRRINTTGLSRRHVQGHSGDGQEQGDRCREREWIQRLHLE